jgi:3'(2'), 5'-bisphosphate nucleotidase
MLENERNVAVEAVTRAASLCQSVRESLISAETIAKMDKSPVTVADFGAQAVIISAIKEAFPSDPIVAEENTGAICGDDAQALREKILGHVQAVLPKMTEKMMLDAIDGGQYRGGGRGRFWTLDPIDGTKGFIRGDQYAIALALIEDGEVVLGVLGCPNLPLEGLGNGDSPHGVILTARRGEGAVLLDMATGVSRQIMVSEEDDPAQAVFCESFESGHTAQGASAEIVHDLGVDVAPARIDSQCKYAVVARGEAGVYMRLPTRADYEEKIWDHAAGVIVVEEAGGRVTDARGEPLDFTQGRTLRKNKGVLASNGLLHDAVVAAIKKALPELG